MNFDALNRFSHKQAVSATAVSQNVLDMGVDRDLAVGTELEVVAVPGTADGSDITGSGTVQVVLQTSDTENFSTVKVLGQSAAMTAADLNAGACGMKLPYGGQRYLRLNYVVTGTVTGLMMTAGVVLATAHDKQYPHKMYS